MRLSWFLLTYILIYGSMNLYFYLRAVSAFSLRPLLKVSMFAALAFMLAAPIVVRFFEGRGMESAARGAAYPAYVWMSVLFFFISVSAALHLYAGVLRLSERFFGFHYAPAMLPSAVAAFMIPLSIAAVAGAYGWFEAGDIRVERVVIRTDKLPAGAGRIKIVQISDVHMGLIVRGERLGRILDAVRAEAPDMVVSTGDLIDGQGDNLEASAAQFEGIRPPLGMYAVMGNHEYYAGIEKTLGLTRQAGFTALRNEVVRVGEHLIVAGADDPMSRGRNADNPSADNPSAGVRPPVSMSRDAEILADIDRAKFTIFLKHRPSVEAGAEKLFDLQLSGHTHGGQIFPFVFVTRLFYPLPSGILIPLGVCAPPRQWPRHPLSQWDCPHIYVSRGSGTWGPPIRFLSRPEVTVFEIGPE